MTKRPDKEPTARCTNRKYNVLPADSDLRSTVKYTKCPKWSAPHPDATVELIFFLDGQPVKP
jgi:hypothetical protein